MNCPNCNAELKDGARFCQNCGTQIAAQEPAFDFNQPEQPAQPYDYQPQQYEQPVQQYDYQPQQYEQPAQPYDYQPQQYGQPVQQYDYQPQQYGQYSTQTMMAPVPKKSPVKAIVIAVVAVVLVAGIALGSFFIFRICNDGSKGSYKDALTDLTNMFNNGKYLEAMEKYSVDGKAPDMNGMESMLSMLNGIKWEIKVDEANSKVYAKGTEEFDRYISYVTDDETYIAKADEVAVVEATMSMSGSVLGQPVNESSDTTIYMARIDGAWKLDAAGDLF